MAVSFSVLLAIGLAGCVPGKDPVQPLAMRRTADGEIEVLYVPCEPGVVKDFRIAGSEPKVTGEPRRIGVPLWTISFDESSSPPDAFVLGELPEGATEVHPWRGHLLDEDWSYAARLDWEGGRPRTALSLEFELGDLKPGIVLYGDENLTEAEFKETDLCDGYGGPDEPPVYPEL